MFGGYDVWLTVETLTWLNFHQQTSGNVAVGTVDHKEVSMNVVVDRPGNDP